jgi:Aspartyl protease
MPLRPKQTTLLATIVSLGIAGCASRQATSVMLAGRGYFTIHYRDTYGLLGSKGHPTVNVSINGVAGRMIVDTGATVPILNMTAVRQCGITLSPESAKTGDFWGDKVGMRLARNITVRLAPDFTVHWPKVMVHPGEENNFGILDYGTLRAGHAVIDTKQKTITVIR